MFNLILLKKNSGCMIDNYQLQPVNVLSFIISLIINSIPKLIFFIGVSFILS